MNDEFYIHFKKELNTWTATLKDTVETKETAGFGETPEEALKDLFLEKNKEEYQNEIREKKS